MDHKSTEQNCLHEYRKLSPESCVVISMILKLKPIRLVNAIPWYICKIFYKRNRNHKLQFLSVYSSSKTTIRFYTKIEFLSWRINFISIKSKDEKTIIFLAC